MGHKFVPVDGFCDGDDKSASDLSVYVNIDRVTMLIADNRIGEKQRTRIVFDGRLDDARKCYVLGSPEEVAREFNMATNGVPDDS